MSINSRRALTLLRTRSHNLGIEVALWNQNQPNIKACKVCKEGLVEDEYHLLFTCSTYSAIRESYDDILRGCDDLNVTLKRTPRRLSSCVCLIHALRLGGLKHKYPFLGRRHTSKKLLYLYSSMRQHWPLYRHQKC